MIKEIKGLGFAFDGCHKIYILETEEDIKSMKKCCGENEIIYPMEELIDVWSKSCSLRFIRTWSLESIVSQFEECELKLKGGNIICLIG